MTTRLPMTASLGGEGANPLIPTGWEVLLLLVGAAVIVLFLVAIFSLSRAEHCTPVQRLLWLLVLLAAPVLGPILWLALGRRDALEPRNGAVR